MAPSATASARRAPTARPRPSPLRRPPLRLFEPVRRRRPAPRPGRRPTIWASGLLIVGSLLAVVVGDALMAEGQVRLSSLQGQVAAAVVSEKAHQVALAQKTAPPVVVGQAESQGMVAPTQVVYLPRVPLTVPLPVPRTTPLPARTTPSPASSATTSGSSRAAAAAAASRPATTSTTAPTTTSATTASGGR